MTQHTSLAGTQFPAQASRTAADIASSGHPEHLPTREHDRVVADLIAVTTAADRRRAALGLGREDLLRERVTVPAGGPAFVPRQRAPRPAVRVTPSVGIPEKARWRLRPERRVLADTTMAVMVLAVPTAFLGALAVGSEITVWMILGAILAFGLTWAAMVLTDPTTVELQHSKLKVTIRGHAEVFDLADPLCPVQEITYPEWRVRLECADGKVVGIDSRHVVPAEFSPIIRHYRRVASRIAEERAHRFAL